MDAGGQDNGGRRRKRDDKSKVDHDALGKLFDRVPPHSIDAERSLLGSLLLDPTVVGEVLMHVSRAEQFYDSRHGAIFRAIVDIYDKHESGDLVQLVEALRSQGVLEDIGGGQYAMSLAEAVPSAANAVHYARLVAETARLRELIDAAGQTIYEAYHAGGLGEGSKEVIDAAEARVFEIAQREHSREAEGLAELLEKQIERIEFAEAGEGEGFKTGFHDLDKMTSGMHPGELTILAARPSMGKTALALNITEQLAFGGVAPGEYRRNAEPIPVGVFSLEMSRDSLVQRLLSARSGVDAYHLRTADRQAIEDAGKWGDLLRAGDELRDAPIFIDDTPALTVLSLRARARRMVRKHGVKVLVIDYLQLLTAPHAARESRQVEVATISRGVKALSRELEVPILCLAQLNRGNTSRDGGKFRPKMSDLRESGSIEQDADVVMLLHREAYYHKEDEEWLNDPENEPLLNLTELILDKQRNGPTGVVKLTWDSNVTRFRNRDPRDDDLGGFSVESRPQGGAAGSHGGGGMGGGGYAPSQVEPMGGAPVDDDYGGYSGNDYSSGSSGGYGNANGGGGYTFAPGKHIIEEDGYRDGGGPDRDDDDDELPPF